MKIIISPAKTMREDAETLAARSFPAFEEDAEQLLRFLRGLAPAEQKALWKCSDKLLERNRNRLLAMDWLDSLEMSSSGLSSSETKAAPGCADAERADAADAGRADVGRANAGNADRGNVLPLSLRTPALLAYEGIQYQYLSAATLDGQALRYLEQHLRILSGVYGVLRPFDGVVPYRLEMQAKAKIGGARDLYAFWGSRLAEVLLAEEREQQAEEKVEQAQQTEKKEEQAKEAGEVRPLIINLASKEYAKAVEPYLAGRALFVTCLFVEHVDGTLRQKATAAKMARGEMVRWMAETGAKTAEVLKNFDRLDYRFDAAESSAAQLVFVRSTGSGTP